jgi:hypothetical protein
VADLLGCMRDEIIAVLIDSTKRSHTLKLWETLETSGGRSADYISPWSQKFEPLISKTGDSLFRLSAACTRIIVKSFYRYSYN